MDKFVVSARKYRPATFASVVGQSSITSTLKNAIERGQLAGAYLFCGPRGVGKTTCARIFAKAINCMNPNGAEACNECESCRAFNEGRSFNIHELDAASNNSVNDIRNLTDQVRIPPQIGHYSVYIIDEVHMLSASAFNAFLKTLEEPPSYAIFILATTEKHKILPTILSRCQIFDFNRIRVEDSVEYMRGIARKEGVTCDDESLNLIAAKADGGMRDALSMFDKAVAFCGSNLNYKDVAASLNVLDYETYFQVTDTLLSGDYAKALLALDDILARGFSVSVFMQGLAQHLRSLLVCKQPSTAHLLEVTGSLLDHYNRQAQQVETEFLFEAIGLLATLDYQIKTSSNQRLAVELALMKISGMGQKKNFDSTLTPSLPELVAKPETVGKSATEPQKAVPESTHHTSSEVAPQVATASARSVVKPSEPPVRSVAEVSPRTVDAAPAKPAREPAPKDDIKTATASPESASRVINVASPLLSITGNLKDLLCDIDGIADVQTAEQPLGADVTDEPQDVDMQSESKINRVREKFLQQLTAERQRIGVAFEAMSVEGNVIKVTVSNDDLREEILRNRNEILSLLVRTAGIDGAVDLVVNVAEGKDKHLLVKAEDKAAYLVGRNPAVADLRAALDLDIE